MSRLPMNDWNKFYEKFKFSIPSQFCVLTSIEISAGDILIDLGCGNGRDSLYFLLNQNILTYGVDRSDSAIKSITTSDPSLHNNFFNYDLTIESSWANLFSNISRGGKRLIFYSRFFNHSLTEEDENTLINMLVKYSSPGDKCYFEFRVEEDKTQTHIFGEHFRRFQSSTAFIEKFSHTPFDLEYFVEGRGMAKFKSEDPFVGRFIFINK